MKRSRSAVIVALAAFAIFGASLASATTVQKFSISDLAKKSETIAVAHVEDVYSRWDDNHKEIYTYISLKVLDGVKGSRKNDVLTIRQIGGAAEGKISVVPGMPTAGYPWVMGLQQGKYTVSMDANGFKQVRNDVDGLKTMSPMGGVDEAKSAPTQPLASFLDGVRGDLGASTIKIQPTE